jgi:hypothetical protein
MGGDILLGKFIGDQTLEEVSRCRGENGSRDCTELEGVKFQRDPTDSK